MGDIVAGICYRPPDTKSPLDGWRKPPDRSPLYSWGTSTTLASGGRAAGLGATQEISGGCQEQFLDTAD